MTDWSKPFTVGFRAMRVSRKTGKETDSVWDLIAGGTITRNQDSSVTESGSITVLKTAILGTDRVRVWADCEWEDGSKESVPLGTFMPNVPTRTIEAEDSTSVIELYGLLQEVADDQFETPYKVAKGTNAVDAAAKILRSCGMDVAPYNAGSFKLGEEHVYGLRSNDSDESDETKLDAVNALLDLAGYCAARTNPYGQVVLEKYVEPSQRSPAWTFSEGANATFLTSMSEERNLRDVKNVVIVTYWNSDKEFVGVAIDDDPNSQYSTVSLGRRNAASYSYGAVPDDTTDAAAQKMANDKAKELLRTNQSVIHRITFTHAYAPVNLMDSITFDYPTGGVSGRFSVRTQTITLDAGIPVECEAQVYERP